jgi:hypothetical protein
MFVHNVRSDSHSNTVSHPKRHESSARPLWKPQILSNALWVSLNSAIMVRVKFCWDGKPCNQMDRNQHSEDTYCKHLQFNVTLRGLEFLENIKKQEYFTIVYKCHTFADGNSRFVNNHFAFLELQRNVRWLFQKQHFLPSSRPYSPG